MYCENCHQDIYQDSWLIHSISCKKHSWYCKDCECAYPIKEQYQHTHTCVCGEYAKNITEHEKNECNLRLVICSFCQCNIQAKELVEHEESCGSRTDICEGCKKNIQLRYLKDHKCSPEKEVLNFWINGVMYKVYTDMLFSGVYDAVSSREKLDDFELSFDGKVISRNDTAENIGLENDDIININTINTVDCPFCNGKVVDYEQLQEHVFAAHSDFI